MTVRELIEKEAELAARDLGWMDEDLVTNPRVKKGLTDLLTRVAEAAAREAVEYYQTAYRSMTPNNAETWEWQNEVVAAVLGEAKR